jgi:hypothetical protein
LCSNQQQTGIENDDLVNPIILLFRSITPDHSSFQLTNPDHSSDESKSSIPDHSPFRIEPG